MPVQLLVKKKTAVGQDICSLELVHPNGDLLPEFNAGAHVDIVAPGGYVRQYSLCNSPRERLRYVVGVLKNQQSRGGSIAIHDEVKEGDLLPVSIPRNLFSLDPDSARILLLAGGIGITPLMSMAEELWHEGADFSFHLFSRSRSRAPFLDWLNVAPYAVRMAFNFDDEVGHVQMNLDEILKAQAVDTHIYVCGPEGFIDATFKKAKEAGFQQKQLHCEYFGAKSAASPKPDSSFNLHLARTGKVLTVPSDRSILQVLVDAGIYIPASCEQGVCGTCVTAVCGGLPDHRDLFLTQGEQALNDRMTPCCSRSLTSDLVLDL